jgi:nicotinate phosphoribosyltransferase
VRIDSGDLGRHAREVRQILDNDGLGAVHIFASGNLDEYILRDLIEGGAPIDGFGAVLTAAQDAPPSPPQSRCRKCQLTAQRYQD